MSSDLQNQETQEQAQQEQPTPETAASLPQEEPQHPQQDSEATGAPQTEAQAPSVPENDTPQETVPATEPAQAEETPAAPAEVPAQPAEAGAPPAVDSATDAAPAEASADASSPAPEAGDDSAKQSEEPKLPKMSDEEAQPIWDELTKALEDNTILTVTCERSISGGAIVSYKGIEGFVPKSQFSGEKNVPQSAIDSLKGEEMQIMVIELSGFEKRRFVGSRKKALKESRYAELNVNDVLEGTVTSLTDYGAFVNLGGGIDGLIHISRMNKSHVEKPSDMLKVNDTVKVRIVDINKEKDRVSLSMKEFTESPWTKIDERYHIGDTVKGKIRSLTDFGAYVKLDQDFSGLIHISDLSWTKRVEHPSEIVKVGEEVDIKITDINRKKRRISLSLRDAAEDPWPKLANVYTVGSTVEGRIKRLFEPGMIVELDHDVDCFVPRGRMGSRKPKQDEPTYKLGDSVQLKVIEIDPEKRTLVCGVPRDENAPQERRRDRGEDIPAKFKASSANEDRAYTLGELADLDKLVLAPEKTETPAPKEEAPVVEETPAPQTEMPLEAAAPEAEAPAAEAPAEEPAPTEDNETKAPDAEPAA